MNFIAIDSEEHLKEIQNDTNYTVLLKHNTTCPISKGVLAQLKTTNNIIEGIDTIYVLDILANRRLSNAIEETYGITHESPQVLLIRYGACIYNQHGYKISAEDITDALKENKV